jgi:hypothetical protein
MSLREFLYKLSEPSLDGSRLSLQVDDCYRRSNALQETKSEEGKVAKRPFITWMILCELMFLLLLSCSSFMLLSREGPRAHAIYLTFPST